MATVLVAPAVMKDLAASLQRLAEAIRLTAAALDELQAALDEGRGNDPYRGAGKPFGEQDGAEQIWSNFGGRSRAN